MSPDFKLICGVLTDDHGNQIQVTASAVSENASDQLLHFWFDGLSDPDFYGSFDRRTTQ
ncbi:hypothetical protein NDR89_19755 [Cupriavidus gilardii]|uniref:DUF2158 domain-containing protein n=1 Tax=Cupriavidus gilardii TaxID=82541 RepID=A0ABY4VNV2_9BURK|nr:hypothetical protein [Cupriavidus gilardii]USE78874.1 hypothetical protein NDR89_19755 [Cupriavidus gilardii]